MSRKDKGLAEVSPLVCRGPWMSDVVLYCWCHIDGISSFVFYIQLLSECHCWWTSESPRAHVTKFYGRLRLIRSVLRASKFSVSKLIEILILCVYYTIPFGFSLFRHFRVNIFYFWNHFVWRRLTDEGSLPEMRIWSILLIKSELKWCIHLSRSFFLYFNYWWVSLLVDQWVPAGTCSQVLRSTSVDSKRFESIKIFRNWLKF